LKGKIEMKKLSLLLSIAVLLMLAEVCQSEVWDRETLTNGFWGLNDQLSDKGIEVNFGITSVYQANVKGGTSTHNHKGRYVGRYDLELSTDLEKLLGIKGGSFFLHGWGGWPDEEGINGFSVGSYFGTNAVSIGNRAMDIVECFYEGPFFSDNLTLAIGKLDFTGIFDASEYADDECTQFLNASLVDDSTIPFPQQGLGVVLSWDITDSWYIMGGIADAQADNRETGFNTALGDEDYFFSILETGVVTQVDSANGPMTGTYRIGLWYDPQPKSNSDASKNYRDDAGFYLSLDQMLHRENADDQQGLGTFFRYGYAPSKTNDLTNFVSAGLQYQGLFEGRDEDVLGFGFTKGFFSDSADTTYTEDAETVYEIYYNAEITPAVSIAPSLQYIVHPGGVESVDDATVLGIRVQIAF